MFEVFLLAHPASPCTLLFDCCQQSCSIIIMSNLRDFAAQLAEARERAARSVSQLLTPPSGSVSSRSGAPFLSVGRAMAGSALRQSGSSLATGDGGGSTGEFSLRTTGGPGDLSVFLLTPDIASKLCLGAVSGGVKFCTRGATCSIQAHTKKVPVEPGHLYISSVNRSAFSQPHVPASLLGENLDLVLQEVHPKAEWVHIFQGLQPSVSIAPAISAVTPAKRKFRYLVDNQHDEDLLIRDLESWDFDTVPSEDLQKLTSLLTLIQGWVAQFQVSVGEDVDKLFSTSDAVLSVIGSCPSSAVFNMEGDECTSLWEAITLLGSKVAMCLESCNATPDLSADVSSLRTKCVSMDSTMVTLQAETATFGHALDILQEFVQ
jgi:hypothetical protein